MHFLLQKNSILLVFLLLTSVLSAQDKFDFNYDYAEFKYDSTTSYLEIYYSFLPNSFYSNKTDSSLLISGILNITLEDSESKRNIMNKNWEISEEFKDSAEYLNQGPLLGVVGLKMPEGKYDFQIMLKDNYKTENFKSYNEEINISQDHYSNLAISDIQLASKILNDKVNENSIFYKNTLEVYPNPASIYTQNYPILYYYCELYNLNAIVSDSLLLQKRVNDSKGKNAYQKSRKLISYQKSIVDVGFVNLKVKRLVKCQPISLKQNMPLLNAPLKQLSNNNLIILNLILY